MMMRALTLFGGVGFTRDGMPVARFHTDKVRALLAYLATEPDRPHARATLAGLLWPDQTNTAALRNLSQTLVRLRDVLGHADADPAPLQSTWQTVQWQPDGITVDVVLFNQLARSADPEDLARAVALYQGEFLAGFALPGCEGFEEWLLLTREYLQQQALHMLHTLAEHYLASGRADDATAASRRQLDLDPLREDAYRQLMRALVHSGHHAAALAVYQRCVQVLYDELAIAPDDETIALADAIRTRSVAGASVPMRASAAPVAETPPPRPVLPSPLAPLVGRAHELAQIQALLPSDVRLLTIVGVAGAGKTRLALTAAWALREAFADEVGWVPLASIAPEEDATLQSNALAAAVGAALGRSFGSHDAPFDELCAYLRERTALLVLDNCEHLPAAAWFVRQLLEAAPRLHVLATSRVLLDLAGETPLRLDGLPVPARNANDPASYAAVQLFLERARRQVRDFDQVPETVAAVARLCRLLDGLPLGIELAARWVAHYTCDEISAEIQADLDFLTVRSGDVPERQRGLRAAFDYSWRLLAPAERRALARLSVFRGVFDRAAAHAVASTHATTLAALVNASLLRHLRVGSYGFHELMRQFATERLAEAGEMELLAKRHAEYYLNMLAQHEAALYGSAPQAAAAIIREMADNLRQAWDWAVAHHSWDGIARSLPGLRQYVRIDGLFYEHAARFGAAAERLDAQIAVGAATRDQVMLLGRLRGTQAYFLERQEARAAAITAARTAITHAATAGDAIGQAYAYLQLSNASVPYIAALAPQGMLPALGWLEQAIGLCRAADGAHGERRYAAEVEAECLLKASTIRIELREYALACALAEQALVLIQQNGDHMQEARAFSFSALALENAGHYETAYHRRVLMLGMARANGSLPQEQVALNNLGCTLIYLGDYRVALEYARATLRISGEWTQNPYENADHYHTFSWAACRAGETEIALDAARQAVGFAQATGIPQNQTLPLLALGDALYDLQRYGEAQAAYAAALALGREQQMPQLITVALVGVARCHLAQNALAAAQAAVDEVLRGPDILTLGSLWEPLRVAETCYRVLQARGDPRADQLLRRAAALLEQLAAAITDHERQRMFREQVAAHRSILAAVAQGPRTTDD